MKKTDDKELPQNDIGREKLRWDINQMRLTMCH
jgi:hypothetical protein